MNNVYNCVYDVCMDSKHDGLLYSHDFPCFGFSLWSLDFLNCALWIFCFAVIFGFGLCLFPPSWWNFCAKIRQSDEKILEKKILLRSQEN